MCAVCFWHASFLLIKGKEMLPRSLSHGHQALDACPLGDRAGTLVSSQIPKWLLYEVSEVLRQYRSCCSYYTSNLQHVCLAGKENFSLPSPLTHWKEKIHVHQKQTLQDRCVPNLSWHVDSCTCCLSWNLGIVYPVVSLLILPSTSSFFAFHFACLCCSLCSLLCSLLQ